MHLWNNSTSILLICRIMFPKMNVRTYTYTFTIHRNIFVSRYHSNYILNFFISPLEVGLCQHFLCFLQHCLISHDLKCWSHLFLLFKLRLICKHFSFASRLLYFIFYRKCWCLNKVSWHFDISPLILSISFWYLSCCLHSTLFKFRLFF